MATLADDVGRQKTLDQERGGNQAVLQARMRAVVDAQRALAAHEIGAAPALRQSRVDLAAISEAIADELPPPAV
jgi:hypothetical protein